MKKNELSNYLYAYETLRDQILSGELGGQTKLTEVMLAEKLGISRTPIRYAISRLENEGLIKNKYVNIPSETDIRHIFQVRSILEGFSAKYCADFITKNSLERLAECIEKSRNGDTKTQLYNNYLFHQIIVEETHNPELIAIIQRMQSIIHLMRCTVTLNHRPHLLDEHDEIYTAIASGDGDLAERLLHEHLAKDLEFSLNKLTFFNKTN